jgi:phage terminase large subunit
VIHTRCKKTLEEFRSYSYKKDRLTDEVLPIIVDKWNHGIDALRYSLDGYIMARGGTGVWSRL